MAGSVEAELVASCRAFQQSVQNSHPSWGSQIDCAALQQSCHDTVDKLRDLVSQHVELLGAQKQQQGSQALNPAGAQGTTVGACPDAHARLAAASVKRQEALDELLQQLDNSAESLYEALEDVPEHFTTPLLHTPDPEDVLRYAHRIRFTCFSRGATVSLPPNPQPWQMAQGVLAQLGRAQAAQRMAQQPAAAAPAAPAALPAAAAPPQPAAPAAAAAAEQAPQAQVQPVQPVQQPVQQPVVASSAFDMLVLNPDLMEVVDDYSSSEDDDDDDF